MTLYGVYSNGMVWPHLTEKAATQARDLLLPQIQKSWDQKNKSRRAKGDKSMPLPAGRIPRVVTYEQDLTEEQFQHLRFLDGRYEYWNYPGRWL